MSHDLKYKKYQHLISDIISQTVSMIPFDIGSHTGYTSSDNKGHLQKLYKSCLKIIKKFNQNISAITILRSYFINHGMRGDMDPFSNQL